ncbi:hypothetical protein PV726_48670 [Streptomyces europaeiscabiei]|uniref:hypothetical protein n=1 Tax=Streptomyces europaeiscabiei TaxID=146819 RepID=UPI0029A0F265|nr:hypothetical protein [Streptomyces europaeiscabiei]MDX3697900.1 hypothetical protein [Streptomyces europaeiscabiei]
MTPLHLAVLALVLLWSLLAYGIRRAPADEVRGVIQVGTRAVVVLALGSLAVLLVDPADVPSVLRAVLARF